MIPQIIKKNNLLSMFIYKITNLINGKIYIGQTTKSIDIRWKQHCKANSYCNYLKNAIQKYGKENFTIEEIDGANSLSELNYLEKHYICKFNSLAPNGYNLQSGGNNKLHHNITKNKLSKIRSNYYKNHPSAVSKQVINVKTKQLFNTCIEAADFYNIKQQTLSTYLSGKIGNPTNLRYVENDKSKVPIGSGNNQNKQVIDTNSGKIYTSAKQVSELFNIKYPTLKSQLQKNRGQFRYL